MRSHDRTNRNSDNKAQLDELGKDPAQVGSDSAGQSSDPIGLSSVEDANEESVEELAETDQAFEANAVLGVEEAADRPEKEVSTHTGDRYRREDDLPPIDGSKEDAA
ncbi:MAG TPA: hypothetical protein VH437_12330 [Terriglobales bacterium]|jgi:hypothetical protein